MVLSYRQWLAQDLIAPTDVDQLLARRLFQAPFVVVSHGTQADPILNYGNQTPGGSYFKPGQAVSNSSSDCVERRGCRGHSPGPGGDVLPLEFFGLAHPQR